MKQLTRRRLVQGLFAGAATIGAADFISPARLTKERVLVVGGGPAGAAAALTLRAARPNASVLLVERDPARLAGTGPRPKPFAMPAAAPDLKALRRAGIGVALDEVVAVDWTNARLALFSGRALAFDTVLFAPGTAPLDEEIPGLDRVARHLWPAAWGSTREARRLTAALSTLPDTGDLVLRLPGTVSHPRAAVARALDLATHLARHRPNARLTVLDGSAGPQLADSFAQQAARAGLPSGTVWRVAAKGGTIRAVDARQGLLETNAGLIRADVVNFVAPHGAGRIARAAGLVDASGWCPCDPLARSTVHPQALIVGDARKQALRTVDGALHSVRDAIPSV